MRRQRSRRADATRWIRRAIWRAVVAGIVTALFSGSPALTQTCPGDCSGDGFVTIDELLKCVNIALDSSTVSECPPCDSHGDGTVTVDELIQGVNAALVGCQTALTARGRCMRPGPAGLAPCAPGAMVSVLRCDDRRTCLSGPTGSTLLNTGVVGSDGAFSISVDGNQGTGTPVIVEAAVDAGTTYRIVDFGSVGSGGAGGRGLGGGAALDDLLIDPVSEAAVLVLDSSGLESFADAGVVEVIAAVRSANEGATFAGLDSATAAALATQTAQSDPAVEQTIQRDRMVLVNIAREGTVAASSVFGNDQFPAQLAVDGDRGTSWFSNGASDGPEETFRWTGTHDDVIASIAVLSNAQNADPNTRTFGFGSLRIQVLTASGSTVLDVTRDLPGATDPDIEVFPEVTGRAVLLTFSGHDDPTCGGFSELQVVARRPTGFSCAPGWSAWASRMSYRCSSVVASS